MNVSQNNCSGKRNKPKGKCFITPFINIPEKAN
jgi:hypothetical protein